MGDAVRGDTKENCKKAEVLNWNGVPQTRYSQPLRQSLIPVLGSYEDCVAFSDSFDCSLDDNALNLLEDVTPSLTELVLSSNFVTKTGLEKLQTFSFSKSLAKLDLSNNKFGGEGLQVLAEWLRLPECQIKHLYLSNCKITDTQPLALSIGRTCKLLELRLDGNSFSEINALCVAMARNTSLRLLNLRWNILSDALALYDLTTQNPLCHILLPETRFSILLPDASFCFEKPSMPEVSRQLHANYSFRVKVLILLKGGNDEKADFYDLCFPKDVLGMINSLGSMSGSLFSHSLLSTQLPHPYLMRPLHRDDFGKGQLTDASGLNDKTFSLAFDELLAANQNHLRHFVVIIEDTVQHKIVATGSLLVERKFTRGTGLSGHIEDIVVLDSLRGASLGRKIIEELKAIAGKLGCYKLILDCSEDNIGFYKKLGFEPKEQQMALYLRHASKL